MDVGAQFNFRSQAILSGYKQHLRIPVNFLYCWLCEGTQNEARASKLSRKSLRVFTSIIINSNEIQLYSCHIISSYQASYQA